MDIGINSQSPKTRSRQKQRSIDPFIKNTWILLFIAWGIYLIPIPGTSYVAFVLSLGALVMTISSLARGKTEQGIIQLLAFFIISPICYTIGMIIFWSVFNKTIDLDKLTAQALKEASIKSYNQELKKYRNTFPQKHIYKKSTSSKVVTHNAKTNKQTPEEIIHIKYIVYLISGGTLECADVEKNGEIIKIINSSGLMMDVNLSQVEKIDKFETKGNKTNITSWKPSGKG